MGSYVHVHAHANYYAVMKVAEGYRNVWKLCIFWLVWANLNHHTVQVALGYRKTVGLLQSVCMCCYHAIWVGSLFRVQLDTRMWFLQVQNAYLSITQTHKSIHTFSTWICCNGRLEWSFMIWGLALRQQWIQCTWSISQHLHACMEGLI